MTSTAARRGQPLVALTGLMGGWVALRVMVPGIEIIDVPVPPNVAKRVGQPEQVPVEAEPEPPIPAAPPPVTRRPPLQPREALPFRAPSVPTEPLPAKTRTYAPIPQRAGPSPSPHSGPPPPAPEPPRSPPSPRLLPFSPVQARDDGKRWSADGWLLWRKGSGSAAALPGATSYGASQAGAVLRYRLSHESALRPRAHLRVTSAIDSADREIAAGIGIQPLRKIPFEILAEGRVGIFSGDIQARPAVVGVFGPPAQSLPLDLTAELYGQGGYVGGTDPTGFVDGQMRVTRAIDIGRAHLQAGAGIWGGAQEGVERVDAGPSVSVTAPIAGGIFARASIDWRERVAGDARPGSGPVVTLSAGF
ncbi:hypothetical protein [Croceicoccus marinus]|nr:hypothetical protein [Croceicoccus marinus]